jgi:hypothetical protein
MVHKASQNLCPTDSGPTHCFSVAKDAYAWIPALHLDTPALPCLCMCCFLSGNSPSFSSTQNNIHGFCIIEFNQLWIENIQKKIPENSNETKFEFAAQHVLF